MTTIRNRAWQDTDQAQESEQAEHAGNGLAICLIVLGLCGTPFTHGVSFVGTLIGGCLLRSTDNGKTDAETTIRNLQPDATEFVTSPKWAMLKFIFAALTVLAFVGGLLLLLAMLAELAGVR